MKKLKNLFKRIDKKSLKFKLLLTFIIFSCFIFILLWLLQTVFFAYFYETNKKDEIILTASLVMTKLYDDNIQEVIDDYSYKYSSNIYIIANNKVLYASNNYENKYSQIILPININLIQDKTITRVKNNKFNIDMFCYQLTNEDNIKVLVTTPVEATESAIRVLKTELLFITITLIIISSIVAIYLSYYLTKPIKKIEEKSKKLGEGNYNVKFETGSYTEVDNLAKTLNSVTTELKKTDDLRRELISNVSHDLKTPLTMIKSYAEMMIDIPQTKEKQDEKLNIIVEETDRLNILVNDIVNLSKLESNIEELNLEVINLSELLKTIVNRFSYLIEVENYIFEVNIEDNLYTKVDKNKISQVIYNLIGNAINYTGKDKRVIIKLYEKNNYIYFEVKDTGMGIDKKDIDNIWDKYYKVEIKHKRNIVSTGLGLSIVRNVLDKHKLKYGVISKSRKGTTFYVVFTKNKK